MGVNPIESLMKAVIAKNKELENDIPEDPQSCMDAKALGKYLSGEEARLVKIGKSMQLGLISIEGEILIARPLDESLMEGVIGFTGINAWRNLLDRLLVFRELIRNGGCIEAKFGDQEIGLYLSEAELERFRKTDYERGACWQINWDTSAQTLKRAADNLLRIYLDAVAKASSHQGPRILVEGTVGWEERYDEQLIGIYYMLMGLAIENLFKGIIMVNHPEYLTPDGLEKISKHETYQFLDDIELKELLKEFEKYKDILYELAEWVKWKAKYPVSKSYKEFKPVDDFIDRERLAELYGALYRRAWRERRLNIIRNREQIQISFQGFMEIRKEINDFRKSSTKIKNIIEAYPQWPKVLILHALDDIAEDLEDKSLKKELKLKIELYNLGNDV